MINVKSYAKEIIDFETKFNGALQHGYKDKEEFKNDLMKVIDKEGFSEILGYYKSMLTCYNDTNSSKEQRKELSDLILILEGVVY
jgi:hypothetical protein